MSGYNNTDLKQWILRCKKRDVIAQRNIYDHFVLSLFNTALRILNDRVITEDAVQNTFIRAFGKIDQYDHEKGRFSSWIHRICINESIVILRKRKTVEDINDHEYLADRDTSIADELDAAYIIEAMKSLPETQHLIFNLFEVEGYSHKEIGELIGINESSSRTYLMRAKRKLQEMLADYSEVKKVG